MCLNKATTILIMILIFIVLMTKSRTETRSSDEMTVLKETHDKLRKSTTDRPFNSHCLNYKCSLRSNVCPDRRRSGIAGMRNVATECYKNFRLDHFIRRNILSISWSERLLDYGFGKIFKREVHALDDAFLSTQNKPYLEPNGMTMVLGGRRVNITSPEFEELLLDILTKIDEEVESLGDKKAQKEYLANFYTNMFEFINGILMPARYRAFKEGRITDNSAVHKIHRVLMRQLYTALAKTDSPLVPPCWKALQQHDDPTCKHHITKEQLENKKVDEVLNKMRKLWKEQRCSEFDDEAFPDDKMLALRADDLDLTGPRFTNHRTIQLRGHKKYNILDEEETEKAILRLYECTQMKISKIHDEEERNCYNLTFIHNMRLFYGELVKYTKGTDVSYAKVRELLVEERERGVIDSEEAYLRNLIRPSIRKNDTIMELGDEDLIILDPKFEENLFRAYIRIERQMNRIEEPHLRKRLMAAFNEYLFEFLEIVLMPIRYKAFEEGKVEGNTYLHMMKRSLMRRLYMSLAQTGSTDVPPCWNDLYKYLDEKPEEAIMLPPLGWDKYDCEEFSERAFPDVTIHALKSDDIDLTAPRFLNPRTIRIRGHGSYQLENEFETESAIVRFYKCKLMKISQIKNDYERKCFNDTFNLNMKKFCLELSKCILDTDLEYNVFGKLMQAIREDEKSKEEEMFTMKTLFPEGEQQVENVTVGGPEGSKDEKPLPLDQDIWRQKTRTLEWLFIIFPLALIALLMISVSIWWLITKAKDRKKPFKWRHIVTRKTKPEEKEEPERKIPDKKPSVSPPPVQEEEKQLLKEPIDTEEEEHRNLFVDPPIYVMVPRLNISEPRIMS